MNRAAPLFCSVLLGVSFVFADDPPPEEKTVLEGVVMNIFNGKCVSCHGASKQKGKLRLDSHAAMLKAGESENAAIVPKNSTGSEAIARIILPEDDDDHMPPKDKPQLSAEETAMLKWWIDAGADQAVKIKDAAPPAELKEKIIALARQKIAPPSADPAATAHAAPPVNARDEKVLALEKELGSPILQVAQNDPGLTFNVINIADKFDDGMLAKLGPLADRFADLNLGRSKVTDAGLQHLASAKNLTRLRLENTAITDAGLDHLANLAKLEYLNLYGTKISDAGLAKLEKLPNLKALYLWQTSVTKPAAESLHGKRPKLVINLGWDNIVGQPAPAAPPPPAAAPAPAPAAASTPVVAPKPVGPEELAYAAVIQPIFNRKCTGCHGADKQKGKYRMDSFEAVMKSGKSGEASVVSGKSAESAVIKRISLPLEEDDHMPPKKKEQLTDKEAKLIHWWIDAGAKTDVKVKDAGIPAELLK